MSIPYGRLTPPLHSQPCVAFVCTREDWPLTMVPLVSRGDFLPSPLRWPPLPSLSSLSPRYLRIISCANPALFAFSCSHRDAPIASSHPCLSLSYIRLSSSLSFSSRCMIPSLSHAHFPLSSVFFSSVVVVPIRLSSLPRAAPCS